MRLGIVIGPGNKPSSWENYQKACSHLKIDSVLVDMKSANWLNHYIEVCKSIDGLLVGPPCVNPEEYSIYMERLYFIQNEFGTPMYPSYNELKLYENKRYCSHWLELHKFPHPSTTVLCDKVEALKYLSKCVYPIVIKAPIGAGASAVHIIRSQIHAKLIVHQIFGLHRLLSCGYVSWVKDEKTIIPIPLIGSSLKHNVVIQEFIPIKWEWRIIKIGDSYFGHQKLLRGAYASGSDRVGWVAPPIELLDMIRSVCERGQFLSMAMDVFEGLDGRFYINELQSMFGSYNNTQMKVNGIPGRYVYTNGEYRFEEGYFNLCGSRLLRVRHFVKILTDKDIDLSSIEGVQYKE